MEASTLPRSSSCWLGPFRPRTRRRKRRRRRTRRQRRIRRRKLEWIFPSTLLALFSGRRSVAFGSRCSATNDGSRQRVVAACGFQSLQSACSKLVWDSSADAQASRVRCRALVATCPTVSFPRHRHTVTGQRQVPQIRGSRKVRSEWREEALRCCDVQRWMANLTVFVSCRTFWWSFNPLASRSSLSPSPPPPSLRAENSTFPRHDQKNARDVSMQGQVSCEYASALVVN